MLQDLCSTQSLAQSCRMDPFHPSSSSLSLQPQGICHQLHPWPRPPTPALSAQRCPHRGICLAQGLWFLTPDLPAATGIPYRCSDSADRKGDNGILHQPRLSGACLI